jgi:hypothetical protein
MYRDRSIYICICMYIYVCICIYEVVEDLGHTIDVVLVNGTLKEVFILICLCVHTCNIDRCMY